MTQNTTLSPTIKAEVRAALATLTDNERNILRECATRGLGTPASDPERAAMDKFTVALIERSEQDGTFFEISQNSFGENGAFYAGTLPPELAYLAELLASDEPPSMTPREGTIDMLEADDDDLGDLDSMASPN